MVRHRVRIRFSKTGDLRLISHRDLVRALERLFRRARLPLGMSEGFHPKPRMSFPSALAVGIAGHDEVMELELTETLSPQEVLDALRPQAPPGLTFHRAEVIPPGTPKAMVRSVTFQLELPAEREAEAARQAQLLWQASSRTVDRAEQRGPIDVRSYLEGVAVHNGCLEFKLRVTPQGTARPREILQALALDDLEPQGCGLARTTVELES